MIPGREEGGSVHDTVSAAGEETGRTAGDGSTQPPLALLALRPPPPPPHTPTLTPPGSSWPGNANA